MRHILCIIFLISGLKVFGQPLDYLQFQLDKYNNYFFPEYVDSHTDRDMYFSGDRLWYTLYLQKTTSSPSSLSIAGYTELRDQNDSVVLRQKVKFREGIGVNEFIIPNHLPTGVYQFVAYTLWMKNGDDSFIHRKFISIINSTLPYEELSSGSVPPKVQQPFFSSNKAAFSLANLSTTSSGRLILYTREKLLEERKVNDLNEPITIADKNSVPLYASFFDENDSRMDMLVKQYDSSLSVNLNKKEYKPRESVSFDLILNDAVGNKLNGNVSISVHRVDAELPIFPSVELLNGWYSSGFEKWNLKYKKEIFLFPKATQLPMVKFQSQQAAPFRLDVKSLSAAVSKAELNRKISKAYGITIENEASIAQVLIFNLSYRPEDYSGFSTMESFIREIVAPVKIRKVRSVKAALIRNSDNPANIHFFKEPALLLADGVIVNNIDEILKIELSDIERLDIMWGTNEINSSGIFSLADNGILSITTKSKTAIFPGEKLFGDIHLPVSFSAPFFNKDYGTLPLFYAPVYWNPEVAIKGTRRINFLLSDEIGQFVIRAKGITKEGKMVFAERKFNVVTIVR